MIVNDCRPVNTKEYNSINAGEVFMYSGKTYIKTDIIMPDTVNKYSIALETGKAVVFYNHMELSIVNAKVVIE